MTREPGDKILPKLIPIIRDTIVDTKKKLGPHEQMVRQNAMQEIIDRAGHEIADLYRPLFREAMEINREKIHPLLQEHIEKGISGDDQWQAAAFALGGTVTGALGTAISNFIAPLAYRLTEGLPNLEVTPQQAAAASVAGIIPDSDAYLYSRRQGYDGTQFQIMKLLAEHPPEYAALTEMINRGTISIPVAEYYMQRNGYPKEVIDSLLDLRIQHLSPSDAALAVLRNNISHEQGRQEAQAWGVYEEQFNVLIGNTGEPPGVMDLLAMFRRGIIDEPTLRHGILQSRVRDEWIPAIEQYRYSPMSTADAIQAAVQNHIPQSEAASIALKNGLEPDHFAPLLETAGEPLAKEELLRLYKRGVITADVVKQGLRESRLKDKYIDDALQLAITIPPLFTIESMIRAGAISDTLAAQWLKDDGYQPDAIKAIIAAGHHQKTVKARTLTEGMLSELYLEKAITVNDFTASLKTLGYSDAESALIVKLDDWRIAKASRDNAISRIRSVYIGHKISRDDASAALDALLVPSAMRDQVLKDWDLELASNVRTLTPAQVAAAWKLDLLDTVEALAYLARLGYSGNDAGMILEIANKGPLSTAQQTGGA